MNYLLTIHHHNIQYQWDINIENGEVYSIPKLNRGMLTPAIVKFIKTLLDSRECTHDALACQFGVTNNRITKLLTSFCQTLNITHCIPHKKRITNKDLLKYLSNSTLEVEIKKSASFDCEDVQNIRFMSIEQNDLEGRANKYLQSIFNLLLEFMHREGKDYMPFFLTNDGVRLPLIYLDYKNKCPFHFPLVVDKEFYEEKKPDSLFNQRFNSGRDLYNGSIFCLRNQEGEYSLGKTHYSSILDSCDYISSRMKEYWMKSYEYLLLNHTHEYLSDSLDKIFTPNARGRIYGLLDTSLRKPLQYDIHGSIIKYIDGKETKLSVALTNEIREVVKSNLISVLHDSIAQEIKNNQNKSLSDVVELWNNRMIDVHNKNFSNYIAGLAFSIPLFQVTKSGLAVLLAKGSQQKAVGSGAKHIVPAGMVEFFSDMDPESFSFDDFRALICKELLEELYFGNNIVHKHTSQYSRTINLFSDNQNERTYATYEEILDTVQKIVIPKWDDIWEKHGKTKENIPSKVLLEKVLELKETDEPYFMIVDALNSRPEIIKPIYFTEDVEVFLNWENVGIARVSFSNQQELENFVKKCHRDFCAPGIASIYLGARYYFENQETINKNLGL